MIINNLDLGGRHAYPSPIVGQNVGEVTVEGIEQTVWPRGSITRKQSVSFWIRAWQGIGGASADTAAALKYLVKQVEELASNRDVQPAYIQWTATAQGAGSLNAAELHDGWYIIDDFEPDYHGMDWPLPMVQCRMTVTQVAPQAPRRVGLSYMGGAIPTNYYTGTAIAAVAAPFGATFIEGTLSVNRSGAEGNIPINFPTAQPSPLSPSATIGDYFKTRVRVYDTISTGSNPVPTTGGTYVNANWVEVFFSDHDFVGDCVITNGLHLWLFQAGTAQIATCYLWNTSLATANWQQFGTLTADGNTATLRQYSLLRVGPEESALVATANTTATSPLASAAYTIRMARGMYHVRVAVQNLTTGSLNRSWIELGMPGTPKIGYGAAGIDDLPLVEVFTQATDYGYAAAFINSASFPFVAGWLGEVSVSGVPTASTTLLKGGYNGIINGYVTKYTGVFAIPYGVNASYSTADLQAEAEGGTLGTGWSSVVDAAGSAGNVAKCASGTVATNADTFGTTFSPSSGLYDVWFRVKVTSAAASSLEMTLGLWDPTASAFVASGSTTFNRNAITTSYAWYRAGTAIALPAAHATRFRAVTALTLTTDWFIDEAALVPTELGGITSALCSFGPRDIWQQYAYDRSTRIVRV